MFQLGTCDPCNCCRFRSLSLTSQVKSTLRAIVANAKVLGASVHRRMPTALTVRGILVIKDQPKI